MKKIMLLVLLLPLASFGQKQLLMPGQNESSQLTSFLGIPFGKSKTECISLMKVKGYKNEPIKNDYITFKGVKFGGRVAASVTFYFYKNRFHHGLVLIIPTREPRVLDEYNTIISSLEEKYGPSEETRDFKSPYNLGDGYESSAIQGGYAEIKNIWADLGPGMITGEISDSLLIRIDYYNIAITKMSLESEKEKDLSEL